MQSLRPVRRVAELGSLGITHRMKTFIALLAIGIVAAVAQSITERTKFVSLSGAATRKLLQTAVTLKKGDSYQTVTNALGKPDLDQSGGFRSDRPGPTSRILQYNVSRPEGASFGNEHAYYVTVSLDFKTDLVTSIFIKTSFE